MSLAGIHRFRPGYTPTAGGGPTHPPQGGSGGFEVTGRMITPGPGQTWRPVRESDEELVAWGIPADSDLGRALMVMEALSTDETGPGVPRTPSHDGSLASLVAWPVWAAVHILTLGRMGRPLHQEEE